MARVLISPQRHSDNFTQSRQLGGGREFCFLLPLREQLLFLCPMGRVLAAGGQTLNLVLQHPSDPSESGLLEGELQLFG